MGSAGRIVHRVRLEDDERGKPQRLVDDGRGSGRRRSSGFAGDAWRRASRSLRNRTNLNHQASIFGVGAHPPATMYCRAFFCGAGSEAALERRVQVNRKGRLPDGEGEATLTVLACSEPPEGHARWSLRLLGDRLVELEVVDGNSTETVRRTLRKTTSSPG